MFLTEWPLARIAVAVRTLTTKDGMAKKRVKPGLLALSQVSDETPISFKVAGGMFSQTANVSRQLLYSWRKNGLLVDGVRVHLGWYREGGAIMTTKEAVERFKRATNGE